MRCQDNRMPLIIAILCPLAVWGGGDFADDSVVGNILLLSADSNSLHLCRPVIIFFKMLRQTPIMYSVSELNAEFKIFKYTH
jgi:hypothetical protein